MSDHPRQGRPSLYTPELADKICANLELAMPLSLAAECEGVNRTTAYMWEERNYGADQHPEGLGFCELAARARARGARDLTKKATAEGKGSSQATWMLERRYREDYAPPKKEGEGAEINEIKITIEGGLPREVRQAEPAQSAENRPESLGGPSN